MVMGSRVRVVRCGRLWDADSRAWRRERSVRCCEVVAAVAVVEWMGEKGVEICRFVRVGRSARSLAIGKVGGESAVDGVEGIERIVVFKWVQDCGRHRRAEREGGRFVAVGGSVRYRDDNGQGVRESM